MDNAQYHQGQQKATGQHDRISFLMDDFKVGTLPDDSGIRKLRGTQGRIGQVETITPLPG